MKTIGIIGGMGPQATMCLFKKIILKTKVEKDQDHIHILIDNNTNIPDRTKSIVSNGESPLKEMSKTAKLLESSKAGFLIMPCNTAHYYYDELTQKVKIPIINMLKETVMYIKSNYRSDITVGLLATDGTIKSGIYDRYFDNTSIKLVKPIRTQEKVMEFIYEGIKKGDLTFSTTGLTMAVDELKTMGAELFVLGCTELSIAGEMHNFGAEFIDPMDILAERSIEFAKESIEKKIS